MDIRRARLYALISFGAALFILLFTLLFSITLAYQAYRDGRGGGLNVLSQFLSSPMKGEGLALTSPFSKGNDYYDRDADRKLIEEMLARYYLEMKYTFFRDEKEMLRRWGPKSPLMRISTPALHKQLSGSSLGNLKEKIRKKSGVDTVDIITIKANGKMNQYVAEIRVNTISDVGAFSSKMYRVTMDFEYVKSYRSLYQEPVNPYGLRFTRVSSKLM